MLIGLELLGIRILWWENMKERLKLIMLELWGPVRFIDSLQLLHSLSVLPVLR